MAAHAAACCTSAANATRGGALGARGAPRRGKTLRSRNHAAQKPSRVGAPWRAGRLAARLAAPSAGSAGSRGGGDALPGTAAAIGGRTAGEQAPGASDETKGNQNARAAARCRALRRAHAIRPPLPVSLNSNGGRRAHAGAVKEPRGRRDGRQAQRTTALLLCLRAPSQAQVPRRAGRALAAAAPPTRSHRAFEEGWGLCESEVLRLKALRAVPHPGAPQYDIWRVSGRLRRAWGRLQG